MKRSNQDLNKEEGVNKSKKRSSVEKLGNLNTVGCNVSAIANMQRFLCVLISPLRRSLTKNGWISYNDLALAMISNTAFLDTLRFEEIQADFKILAL